MSDTLTPRLLILGAHPDDAEFHAGGLACWYRQQGYTVKSISVTNGGAGHHRLDASTLIATRRREFEAAASVIGATAETWDFPDGSLEPTLEVREAIIREIRSFGPDLVLTHRTCDYHPDHRAVGQAVQDASYMVTVPLVVPEVPVLKKDPVVAYMVDLFTKPCPFEPTVLVNIDPYMDTIVAMLAEHRCQVFDFLPANLGFGPVPESPAEQLTWLRQWYGSYLQKRSDRFAAEIAAAWPNNAPSYIEAYEVSEYARELTDDLRRLLFP